MTIEAPDSDPAGVTPPAPVSPGALLSAGLVALALLLGCGGFFLTGSFTSLVYPVLLSPAIALVAVILGIVALRSIDRSGGAVGGRPLAIAGTFVGLGATAVLGAFSIFAVVQIAALRTLAPVAGDLAGHLQRGETTEAREILGVVGGTALTDERLVAFGDALETEIGVANGARAGFDLVGGAARAFADAPQNAGASFSAEDYPRPIWLLAGGNEHLAYAFLDQEALEREQVRVNDLLVIVGPRRAIALQPDGPALRVIRAVGWEDVAVDAAAEGALSSP